jgi:Spy/CpxP family protein refolding chaperone
MRMLMLAAALAAGPVLFAATPRTAAAAEPGVRLIQWNGDEEHHDDYDHHHDGERERVQRWGSFFRARMHEHFEHEGDRWRDLPQREKEHVIREEWDHWGERTWRG